MKKVFLMNGPKAGDFVAIGDDTESIEVQTYIEGCSHLFPSAERVIYVQFRGEIWKTADGADYKKRICPDCIVAAEARRVEIEKEIARQNRWHKRLKRYFRSAILKKLKVEESDNGDN